MNNNELKEAFVARRPVVHNGIIYERISAIIYRLRPNGTIYTEAELMDKCGHSVSIVSPERVKDKED
jgi:hypothetical protein